MPTLNDLSVFFIFLCLLLLSLIWFIQRCLLLSLLLLGGAVLELRFVLVPVLPLLLKFPMPFCFISLQFSTSLPKMHFITSFSIIIGLFFLFSILSIIDIRIPFYSACFLEPRLQTLCLLHISRPTGSILPAKLF